MAAPAPGLCPHRKAVSTHMNTNHGKAIATSALAKLKRYPRHYTIPGGIAAAILLLAGGHAMLAGRRAPRTPAPSAAAPAPATATLQPTRPAPAIVAPAPLPAAPQTAPARVPAQAPAVAPPSPLRPPVGVAPGRALQAVESESAGNRIPVARVSIASPSLLFQTPSANFAGASRTTWTAWIDLLSASAVAVLTASGAGTASAQLDGGASLTATPDWSGKSVSSAAAVPLGAGWHQVTLVAQPDTRSAMTVQLAFGDGVSPPSLPIPYGLPPATPPVPASASDGRSTDSSGKLPDKTGNAQDSTGTHPDKSGTNPNPSGSIRKVSGGGGPRAQVVTNPAESTNHAH